MVTMSDSNNESKLIEISLEHAAQKSSEGLLF